MSFEITELMGWIALLFVFSLIIYSLANNFTFIRSFFDCPKEGEPIAVWKFWCKGEQNAEYYDLVAEASVNALTCAVNSAGRGEFTHETCPGEVITAGFSSLSLQGSSVRCFGELGDICVSCSQKERIDDSTEVFRKRFYSFENPSTECQKSCSSQERCTAERLTETKQTDYYSRDWGSVVACTCKLSGVASQYKEHEGRTFVSEDISFFGAVKQCSTTADAFGGTFELLSCSSSAPQFVDYNSLYTPEDFTGKACDCNYFGPQQFSFTVYGKTEAAARDFCNQDISLADSFLHQGVSPSVGGCRDFSGKVARMFDISINSYDYSCKKGFFSQGLECTVTNFQLPQEVGTGSEIIPYFGMPQRLAYWQQFPLDEDTWSESNDFLVYSTLATFVLIGPFKTLKIIAPARLVAKWEALKTSAGKITPAVIKSLMENRVITILTKTSWAATKFAAATGTAVSYESWKDKRAELMAEYVKPHSNSIVLLKALSGAKDFSVDSSLTKKPVLLQWTPGSSNPFGLFNNDEKDLHFASPCAISKLTASKTLFGCQEYIFDPSIGTRCITNHDGVYNSPPVNIPSCSSTDPRSYPKINEEYQKSSFKSILDPLFSSLSSGTLPSLPIVSKTFFSNKFYHVPLWITGCSKGTQCKETAVLHVEEELNPEGADFPVRVDRLSLTQEYMENSEKKTEEKNILFNQNTEFSENPYPLSPFINYEFISEDKNYYLTIMGEAYWQGIRPSTEKFLAGRIYKAEDKPGREGQPANAVYFGWRLKSDELTIRELTITYKSEGILTIRLSDDGNNDGTISSVIVAKNAVPYLIPTERDPKTDSLEASGFRLIFSDKDNDGTINVRGAKDNSAFQLDAACITEGVVIKDIEEGTPITGDDNYCFRQQGTLAKIGVIAGWAGVVGSIFTGGWVGTAFIMAQPTGVLLAEYHKNWPNGGIG